MHTKGKLCLNQGQAFLSDEVHGLHMHQRRWHTLLYHIMVRLYRLMHSVETADLGEPFVTDRSTCLNVHN